MQVQNDSIVFDRWSDSGPRELDRDVVFRSPVRTATSFLTGFNVRFSPRDEDHPTEDDDHELGNLDVRLDADVLLDRTTVRVTATFGLRDWSGYWDDDYEGEIFFAVVAE